MTNTFLRLFNLLISLYSLAIVLRAFLPWLGLSSGHPVLHFLIVITEPLLAPLRRFVPPVGNLDFTPMAALAILWVLEMVVRAVATALF